MYLNFISYFVVLLCCGSAFSGLASLMHSQRQIGPPRGVDDKALPPDQWVLQILDHFDPTNSGTWWQRYRSNATWFKTVKSSPIFLMIGGESEASAKWLVKGSWMEYAQEYNALCFQLEHRFYGKSQPKDDLSVENLRYLSSEQALADIAYFIQHINQKYRLVPSNKWVVFGGGYSGSLAAWARMKYPHLIHAAVSSSAPLLAEAEFLEYYSALGKTLSKPCSSQIEEAALGLDELLDDSTDVTGLSEKFNLCEPLNISNDDDVTVFLLSLMSLVIRADQYNNASEWMSKSSTRTTVDSLCYIMTNGTRNEPLDRYAEALSKLHPSCLDISHEKYVNDMRNVSYQATQGARPWTYQTCTELGGYETPTMVEVFESLINLKYFVNQCKTIFGNDFDRNRLNEGIKRTNLMYGHKNIDVSRVVFLQGTLDPRRALEISVSLNPDAPAIHIQGATHCADLYPSSPNDSPQLKAARERTVELLGQWLTAQ